MEGFGIHPDTLKQIDTQRHQDAMRRAARWRQAQSAGISTRPARPACHLLCQVGHGLVKLGRRLERYDAPQTA